MSVAGSSDESRFFSGGAAVSAALQFTQKRKSGRDGNAGKLKHHIPDSRSVSIASSRRFAFSGEGSPWSDGLSVPPDAIETVVEGLAEMEVAVGGGIEEVDGTISDNSSIEPQVILSDLVGFVWWPDGVDGCAMMDAGLGFELTGEELKQHKSCNFLADAIGVAGVKAFQAMPDLQFAKRCFDSPACGIQVDQRCRWMAKWIQQTGNKHCYRTVSQFFAQQSDRETQGDGKRVPVMISLNERHLLITDAGCDKGDDFRQRPRPGTAHAHEPIGAAFMQRQQHASRWKIAVCQQQIASTHCGDELVGMDALTYSIWASRKRSAARTSERLIGQR